MSDLRPWTVAEGQALAELSFLGVDQLAKALGRSRKSIRNKASRMGVSVKKRQQTSGTELGHAAIARVRANAPGLICPECGQRLAAIRKTGLCVVCHEEHLTERHDLELAKLVDKESPAYVKAHRDCNASKTRLKRKRKELGIKATRGSRPVQEEG